MSGNLREVWREKYREAEEFNIQNARVLTGFNTHVDEIQKFENTDLNLEEVEEEEIREASSEEEVKKVLKEAQVEGRNLEVSTDLEIDLDGRRQIGGQAGIVSNFISGIGQRSLLYTPFLSEKVVELLEDDVLYPVIEDGLVLKSAVDAVNSDRTKTNQIVEFEESSCRVIISQKLRGFGPYFRKGVEQEFESLEDSIDRAFFSGFHDAEGNIDSKLQKAEKQLRKLEIPKHLEFVSSTEEKDRMIMEKILPYFESVGMDSAEMHRIGEEIGHSVDENPSLGDAFRISRELIEEHGVDRVHVHTKRFIAVISERSYPVRDERMLESLLFAGLSAASTAGKGAMPEREEIALDKDMFLGSMEELEHFEDFFDLEGFAQEGSTRLEGFKIIAAPALLHKKPERLVGLGDIISATSFTGEVH